MFPNLRVSQKGMTADPINNALQFNPPILNKIFLKPPSDLFFRQRRDGNDCTKLARKPLMKPVKVVSESQSANAINTKTIQLGMTKHSTYYAQLVRTIDHTCLSYIYLDKKVPHCTFLCQITKPVLLALSTPL